MKSGNSFLLSVGLLIAACAGCETLPEGNPPRSLVGTGSGLPDAASRAAAENSMTGAVTMKMIQLGYSAGTPAAVMISGPGAPPPESFLRMLSETGMVRFVQKRPCDLILNSVFRNGTWRVVFHTADGKTVFDKTLPVKE